MCIYIDIHTHKYIYILYIYLDKYIHTNSNTENKHSFCFCGYFFRVAPPPLVSNGVNGVTMSSPQAALLGWHGGLGVNEKQPKTNQKMIQELIFIG